jgi:signal transduction histidine kinase
MRGERATVFEVEANSLSVTRFSVPRDWPILAALGVVVLLVLGTIGVDLVVARRVARKTAEIVENSQRSIELVDDLRAQVHSLADLSGNSNEVIAVTRRIGADARAYDPLATAKGEREEWNHLQAQLELLKRRVEGREVSGIDALTAEIGASMDRLVLINRESAHAQSEAIQRAHRQATIADASVGAITVALVTAIALVLLRVLRRQRSLTAEHVALMEARNRDLDAFAERAAHDLRTPLNPIRGYADLLLAGGEPPHEIQQMASRIRMAVDRMSRVIDDMLELSRAGAPPAGRASLRAVAAEVLEELGPDLLGAEVHVELTDVSVSCAPGVLGQILRNLISNAIKFRSRSRRLVLRLQAAAHDSVVELFVEDNGTGMDPKDAAHAFQPYFRGRRDREVPGHGLGLAIVERATRAVGGTCQLSSQPDRGTRILVRLPTG